MLNCRVDLNVNMFRLVQVVDYIINAVKSTAPGAELSDEDIDIRDGFSGWEWIVLNICEVWCTF